LFSCSIQEETTILSQSEKNNKGWPQKYDGDKIKCALDMLRVNGGKHSINETSRITGRSRSTLLRNKRKIKENNLLNVEVKHVIR
jgi:hypothetical protein